jgi:hypothetical protein
LSLPSWGLLSVFWGKMKSEFLRKKYPRFIFENYSYKISKRGLEIFFDFKIKPNIGFNPRITIKGVNSSQIKRIKNGVLNNLIFNLGLIEILSYWKATCSPKIEIKAGNLNKEQIKWWKDLIINGMGQFFYENRINFQGPEFLQIISKFTRTKSLQTFRGKTKNQVLVPVGGGKDSIVTLEILKKNMKITCFSLNPTNTAKKVIKKSGCKNSIIVERKIDQKLLKLNQEGFLNGHTPISAYLAFLTVFLGVISNKKYIVFSNERSSNEGNLKYLGQKINHQYSKSFDFEKKFRKYSKKYLAKNVGYFSFLRPLYEIQITKLFSRYEKYFKVFLSCNEAYKTESGRKKPTGKWCGRCPKCLFVFICLYPFLEKKKLIKIFKQNLFGKKDLLPLMKELIGMEKFKPFECVGTKKESLAGLYLSWKKSKKELKLLPYLLKYFENNILEKHPNLEKESKKIMTSWDSQNNLPEEFKKILKKNKTLINS